jgi:hypothetical protein
MLRGLQSARPEMPPARSDKINRDRAARRSAYDALLSNVQMPVSDLVHAHYDNIIHLKD